MMLQRRLSLASAACRAAERITATEYAGRRKRLIESVRRVAGQTDRDLIVLLRGARRPFIAPDVPGLYRQCSHFRYLSGITIPNCYYLIHAPKRGQSLQPILFMDRRSSYEELWEGALPSESVLESTAGFVDLLPTKKITEVISKFISLDSILFFEAKEWVGTEIYDMRAQFGAYHGIKSHIDQLRVAKSVAEVDCMRDVCKLGSEMVSSTISSCRGFKCEAAIVGLLEFEARRRGANMLAYPPVVAAGARANVIHYLDANNRIGKDDCILMDAGCDLNGYVSDITRCYPISGEFTSPQRILYDALLYVHEQLLVYANDAEKYAGKQLIIATTAPSHELAVSETVRCQFIELGVKLKELLQFVDIVHWIRTLKPFTNFRPTTRHGTVRHAALMLRSFRRVFLFYKVRLSNLYSRMIELIASAILDIGLIPQTTDHKQLLDVAESLCPHHVSHYLGMDVHDCTTVSRDMDIPVGTIFTIEPGLYIPIGSSFPEEFRGIGFRIEDDILKTKDGIEVLTDAVPRSSSEIEYLMRSQ